MARRWRSNLLTILEEEFDKANFRFFTGALPDTVQDGDNPERTLFVSMTNLETGGANLPANQFLKL